MCKTQQSQTQEYKIIFVNLALLGVKIIKIISVKLLLQFTQYVKVKNKSRNLGGMQYEK